MLGSLAPSHQPGGSAGDSSRGESPYGDPAPPPSARRIRPVMRADSRPQSDRTRARAGSAPARRCPSSSFAAATSNTEPAAIRRVRARSAPRRPIASARFTLADPAARAAWSASHAWPRGTRRRRATTSRSRSSATRQASRRSCGRPCTGHGAGHEQGRGSVRFMTISFRGTARGPLTTSGGPRVGPRSRRSPSVTAEVDVEIESASESGSGSSRTRPRPRDRPRTRTREGSASEPLRHPPAPYRTIHPPSQARGT